MALKCVFKKRLDCDIDDLKIGFMGKRTVIFVKQYFYEIYCIYDGISKSLLAIELLT